MTESPAQPQPRDRQQSPVPAITLPKGGGAIRGIGEKFAANPVTGTGSMTVPIATSPGRAGFGPQLALSYDSGSGNGPFGFGWSLGLPALTRKTDKGLPQYHDGAESDVFLLSGAEDLVPVPRENGSLDDLATAPGYAIRRYRPRIEGLFARIERWTSTIHREDVHWRSWSRDNLLTTYGKDPTSRIYDPADPSRIFSWLICETRDTKGNAVIYCYKAEDGAQVDLASPPERNRGGPDDPRRAVNRYLKRIRYGNRLPLLDSAGQRPRFLTEDQLDHADWCFEVVFDYGEHDPDVPSPEEKKGRTWPCRPDPFSTYRPGFEVRTYRLCRRVLMFHHFPGEPGVGCDCLVRSTDFGYATSPIASFLVSVTQRGYRRDGTGYICGSMPTVEFGYSQAIIDDTIHDVDAGTLENLPIGIDGAAYRLVDLDSEALEGVLADAGGAWRYKPNLGGARFGPMRLTGPQPSTAALASGGQQLLDLAGDGSLDLVSFSGPTPGFFERTDGTWDRFRPFRSLPQIAWDDPSVRMIDLTGDGHADALLTEDDVFTWYPSLGEDGFAEARRVYQPRDEEQGPRLVDADGIQQIYLADMSGDGLNDLVRVRNGEVCYWPSLGYGRFGAKITMANAPVFDQPDQFSQRRLRVADIDGSSTTDLIYLGRDGVRLYFNQSGNGWSDARPLSQFPPIDDLATVTTADLLGNGTACLVWSSPLPQHQGRQLRYIDLMSGHKPHLLIKTSNNLGAETRVHYAPSTKFYLQDKAAGRPWVTRLPFPVHVVERVETCDWIGRNRFVTRYAYHHGFFDGVEREFRGFAMVEQWDTETMAVLTESADSPVCENVDGASHVPPVQTKTWFHTGAYLGRGQLSRYFAGLLDGQDIGEYYREPLWRDDDDEARKRLLDDTVLPGGLTPEEEREACRALKGSTLRQEIYAQDGTTKADTPYTVTEQNFTVRTLQARGANRHAVFLVHPREVLSYHYERNPADPRIQHALTLEVDAYGNVLKQAAIAYGRRQQIRVVSPNGQVQQVPNPGLASLAALDRPKQTTALLTYTENRVTNAVESPDAHRTPVPCEILTFELTGYPATGPAGRFRAADLVELDTGDPGGMHHRFTDQVAYEAAPTGNPCRRPVERARTLYRSDDLTTLLPLGQVQPLALPGESYTLAFTPGLLTQVFQRPHTDQPAEPLLPDPAAVLSSQADDRNGDRGGYLQSQALKADGLFPASDADDHWWIPSGRSFFTTDPADDAATEVAQARRHFFLSRRSRDPFGHDAVVDFDDNDLLMAETRDALGNRVTVDINDYRVLQPRLVSDPNRNQTEIAFDTLGLVVGTAVMGKPAPAPAEGDTLAGFATDLTQAQLDGCFGAADPHASAPALLQSATTRIVYDLNRFRLTRQANPTDPTRWLPAGVATLARETHVNAPLPPHGLKIQLSFSYSDGFGREIQKKIQAEPEKINGIAGPPRWVGSGWTVYNNKGKPVRRFEPFFSRRQQPDGTFVSDHRFEFGVTVGVSPVLFYDPAGRVIATLHPNHTYEKVVFDPWQQTTYDVNDTCAPCNAQTGDPRTDPDIQGQVARYFAGLPASPPAPAWQTWRAERIDGALGPHEQAAAVSASAHADTPRTVHMDTLGRPFLTVARNRVVCAGHDLDGTEDSVGTRVEVDIEGNQREVRHERTLPVNYLPTGALEQRIVMRYTYDMLGNRIHQFSMESGARWMLNDVTGKPIRAWDSRGHIATTSYDVLRRLVEQTVRGTIATGDAASDPRTLNRDILVDKIEYGEPSATASQAGQDRALRLNLRTHILRHFDSAGIATNARLDASGVPLEAYDFKGNALRNTRRFVTDHTAIPDWSLNPQLQAETFEGSTRYDALNRAVQSIAPHSSLARATRNVIQPVFNEANLLERVDVWLEQAAEPTGLLDPGNEAPATVGVANIDYDAKGQRLQIDYKNGASTRYRYDTETFRLTHLYTRRGSAFTEDCDNSQPPPDTIAAPETPPQGKACGLQNLHYTYDPAGNITHIQDDAQQTVFFRNQRIEPSNDYIYDALYRLIQASGREHLGQQANGDRNPPTAPHGFNAFHTRHDHPNMLKAMGTYVELYMYDAVGNILQMHHRGSDPAHAGWTRAYDYLESSLIEDGNGGSLRRTSNRLSRTTSNPNGANPPLVEAYQHDAHGNMVRMPHLGGGLSAPNMHWDYRDHLQQTDLDSGAAFYVYDASGQRVRKVWEKAPGLIEERIYLGGFEVFRKHSRPMGADTATLERETLHVMDDKQRIALVETRTLDMAGTDVAPRRLIRFQFGNHLGSASLELDEQAQIISYEEYSPYGSSTYQAVRSQRETRKRYRYTGKERDEESGLYYHGARYYTPWLGRWTSTDPSGLEHGINLYAYCHGNPVNKVDLDGQAEKDVVAKLLDILQRHNLPFSTEVGYIPEGGVQGYHDIVVGKGGRLQIEVKVDVPGTPYAQSSYTPAQQINHPLIEVGKTQTVTGGRSTEYPISNVNLAAGEPIPENNLVVITDSMVDDEFINILRENFPAEMNVPGQHVPPMRYRRGPNGERIPVSASQPAAASPAPEAAAEPPMKTAPVSTPEPVFSPGPSVSEAPVVSSAPAASGAAARTAAEAAGAGRAAGAAAAEGRGLGVLARGAGSDLLAAGKFGLGLAGTVVTITQNTSDFWESFYDIPEAELVYTLGSLLGFSPPKPPHMGGDWREYFKNSERHAGKDFDAIYENWKNPILWCQ